MLRRGQIVFQISNRYEVLVDDQFVQTSAAGVLRLSEQSPCVGDWVEISPEQVIVRILPRRNELVRPRVANVDQVVIVAALTAPHLNLQSLYQLIAVIEFLHLPVVLLFTKQDLVPMAEPLFEDKSYVQFQLDAREVLAPELVNAFSNKLSVLAGVSGVGKSTLMQALTGQAADIGITSMKTQRGKHTTRAIRMLKLKDRAGSLIDTPGFSLMNMHLSKTDLARSYHDFRALALKCKFTNCLHDGPQSQDCAVKNGVASGLVSAQKYHFYLKLLQATEEF